ncbi:hypothetical protein A3762_03185 [Oleiphilus sp. HI0125]|uniref:YbgA family protein n=2 Tax=Oleiphilus sp. HI0125 TaxID=1822266 RepID=UPI0007C3CC58|nr:DUF523 and DUF1722 domain-containing protein [Oleiphilus sp. HI0125]KZZ60575.1 hypothetical protein A3762_03185 [Oleiphilus sp. HI0125]
MPDQQIFPDKERILIGISSCLLGEKVRFDTGHKHHSYISNTLGQYFTFHPFCPEMAIGLGTPRETIRLVEREDRIHAVGTKTEDHDVSIALRDVAEQQKDWHKDLCGYILKKDSPSCGMERVKVYKGKNPKQLVPERIGAGLYAEVLLKNFPNLPVEEEGRLGDAVLRENFIKRVYVYRDWQDMIESGLTMKKLLEFHAAYKYSLLAHDQERARALGTMLGGGNKQEVESLSECYFVEMMRILKIRATRKNHVNVLQHLQGFLKNNLDKEDKAELVETIMKYRDGILPLIVPIVLLKHHFRRHPIEWIDNCMYLNAHPGELMLFNSL